MALSKQKYHQVGTPRVYCDLVQYLKAIGKHHRRTSAWEGSDNLHENDIGSQGWDMNPVRQRIGIVGTPPGGWLREYKQFAEIFEGWTVVEQLSNDFKKLLNGVTYYGILGHNLSSLSDDGDFIVDISCYGVAPNQSTTTLIGDGYDGTGGGGGGGAGASPYMPSPTTSNPRQVGGDGGPGIVVFRYPVS